MTAQPSGTEYLEERARARIQRGASWRKAWAESHPEDERHGSMVFYGYWACRCTRCRRAKHNYFISQKYPDNVVSLYHEPTPYTVAEHRAFGEGLCPACSRFVETFEG